MIGFGSNKKEYINELDRIYIYKAATYLVLTEILS